MQKVSLRLLTSLRITLLVTIVFTPSLYANINNIKGTYDILKPEYKHFSVIHGAVAWETGTIRRLYDFGALGKHGGKIQSKTIALVHKIFYRNPQTEGISDFVISNNLLLVNPQEKESTKKKIFEPEIIVSFVAVMIGELEKLKSNKLLEEFLTLQKDPGLISKNILAREAALSKKETTSPVQIQKESIKKEKTPEEMKKIAENIIRSQARKAEYKARKAEDLNKVSTSASSSYKISPRKIAQEKKTSSLERTFTPEEITQEITISRKELIKKLTKQIPNLKLQPQAYLDLIPFIFDAYLECVIEDYMPNFTPHLILLSFLYEQTKCNKVLIRQFYEFLNKDFSCLVEKPKWDAWEKESFTSKNKKTFLEKLLTNPVTNETLDEWYEQITFVFLVSDFPPIQGYSNALIKNDEESALFADCMDNTIRILINFLCYNQETKLFDINSLKERLGIIPHESVQNFYEEFKDPSSTDNKKVHNAWAQTVISNIPFVAYNRTLPGGVTSGRGAVNGLTKENNFYMQPTPGAFLYEINPSLKNTIIALNHLLRLNLFAGPNGDITEEEFLNNNFVETYLPKLAEALKSPLPENYDLKKTDTYDYTERELFLPFSFTFESINGIPYAFSATIKTSQGHGEIELIFDDKKENILESVNYTPTSPLSLIFMSEKNASNLSTSFLQLFSHDLENASIKNIPETEPCNQNILNLLLFIALENADKFIAMKDILHLNNIAKINSLILSKNNQTKILKTVMEGYLKQPLITIPFKLFALTPDQKNIEAQIINLFRSFSPLEKTLLEEKMKNFEELEDFFKIYTSEEILKFQINDFEKLYIVLIIYLDLLHMLIESNQETHKIHAISQKLAPFIYNLAMNIRALSNIRIDTGETYIPLFERIAPMIYSLEPNNENIPIINNTFYVVVSESKDQELVQKSLSFFKTLQDSPLKKELREILIEIEKDSSLILKSTQKTIKKSLDFH